MEKSRALRGLLLATAMLGLASCSERMPSQPAVATPVPPTNIEAVSDSTLQASQAQWLASRPETYRYRFRWECYCGQEYIRLVDIAVTRGTIVSVTDVETGQPLNEQEAARYRTIDGLFDFVHSAIAYPAASVNGAFDPGLGYPSAMHVDYVAGMADEEMGFRIYSLTQLRSW